MRCRGAVLAVVALMVTACMAGTEEPSVRMHLYDRGHGHVRGCARAVHAETFTLENGLQIVVLPRPGSPEVSFMVWYKVGGADDPAGKSGLAHLVEHATFRNTGTQEQHDPVQSMAHYSAAAGEAFTSYDYTAYYHVVPRERLATVMHLEADRMATLHVSDAALALEQEEIVAERRAEIDDVPETRLDLHLRAML